MFTKPYRIEQRQDLPIELAAAWGFFSNPQNLSKITPAWLAFDASEVPDEPLRPGAIFQYRVSPMLGLRLNWTTEITQVVPHQLFVDEQRFGPYRFWHHQHLFEPIAGGVRVRDVVHYALPFGPIGRLVHALRVRRQLEEIFAHRVAVLKSLFGELTG